MAEAKGLPEDSLQKLIGTDKSLKDMFDWKWIGSECKTVDQARRHCIQTFLYAQTNYKESQTSGAEPKKAEKIICDMVKPLTFAPDSPDCIFFDDVL